METAYKPRRFLHWIIRGLALFALVLCTQQVLASSITIECNDLDNSQQSCIPSEPLTSAIIGLATELLKGIGGDLVEEDAFCKLDNNNELICNIGSGDHPVNLKCVPDENNDSVSCSLSQVENAYSIDCSKDTTDNSGQCTINSDTGALLAAIDDDLLKSLPGNTSSILNSFLSCVNGNSFGSANSTCNQLLAAIQDSEWGEVEALVFSILPLSPETAITLSGNHLHGAASAIQQRLSRLRHGHVAVDTSQSQLFFDQGQWHEAGTRLASNANAANDASQQNLVAERNISEFGKLGFFVNASVTRGKYRQGSLVDSDFDSAVLTLGFDYRTSENMVNGFALNTGQSKADYDADISGKLEADSYSFIVYNSYYYNNWYIDTALTVGGANYDQLRNPATADNSFETSFHGRHHSLSGAVGYDFIHQRFNVSPYAQLTLGRMKIDSYRERETNPDCVGLCGAALNIDSQAHDIGMLHLGTQMRYVFTTSRGVFIPVLTLAAVNDFENDMQTVTGRFVGITNDSDFAIKTENMDSSYFVIGTGMSFQLKNGNAGFINLESVESYSYLDQYRLTMGWRWEL